MCCRVSVMHTVWQKTWHTMTCPGCHEKHVASASSYSCWISLNSQSFTIKLKFLSWLSFTFQTEKLWSNYQIKIISSTYPWRPLSCSPLKGRSILLSVYYTSLPPLCLSQTGLCTPTKISWVLYSLAEQGRDLFEILLVLEGQQPPTERHYHFRWLVSYLLWTQTQGWESE